MRAHVNSLERAGRLGLRGEQAAIDRCACDASCSGLPEEEIRVGAARAPELCHQALAAPKLDLVDVDLVVPVVDRRLLAAQSTSPGSAERIRVRVQETGWYFLEVKASTPGAGRYSLRFRKGPRRAALRAVLP